MNTMLKWSDKRQRFYKITHFADRFWQKVDVRDADSCWPWIAGTNGRGRGLFYFNGRWGIAAHAALIIDGRPLNPGELACHICDNPICVNPKHLYAGTHTDNINDAYARGQRNRKLQGKQGSYHAMAKLNEDQVVEIRRLRMNFKITFEELGKRYGVSQTTIHKIVARITWRHVS